MSADAGFSVISSSLHDALVAAAVLEDGFGTAPRPLLRCDLDVVMMSSCEEGHIGHQLVVEEGTMIAFALGKESVRLVAQYAEEALSALLVGHQDHAAVLRSTLLVLCLSPMRYSVWNVRKRALLKWVEDSASPSLLPILYELIFLNVIQSKHPKTSEPWAHRGWLVCTLLGRDRGFGLEVSTRLALSASFVRESLGRCGDKHPRNYVLWSGYMHPVFASLLQHLTATLSAGGLPLEAAGEALSFMEWAHVEFGALHPRDVSYYNWFVESVAGLARVLVGHAVFEHQIERLAHLCVRGYVAHTRQMLAALEGIGDVGSWDEGPLVVPDALSPHELYSWMKLRGSNRMVLDGPNCLMEGLLVIRKTVIRGLFAALPPPVVKNSGWFDFAEFELSIVDYLFDVSTQPHRPRSHAALVAEYYYWLRSYLLN